MRDVHEAFTRFKAEFPTVYADYEALGKEIHEKSGPLPEKIRWLLKIAISGASGHKKALETHICKGRESGLTDDEIRQRPAAIDTDQRVLMRAYEVFSNTK